MKFALVLGNRADFGDLGDLGAVGELGGTALVGLIGGNLGFRAFTSHPDVETAVACSKQIYNESDTKRMREICKNWLAYMTDWSRRTSQSGSNDENKWGTDKSD